MKIKILISLACCLVVFGFLMLFKQPMTVRTQSIRLTGFTNGFVGVVATINASLSSNNAASFQHWLDAGTNSAVFAITNQQTCAIWLYPVGRICSTNATQASEETLLINTPTFSGIKLSPGQHAEILVAVTPQQSPWRLQVYYSRDSCSDSFLNRLKMLPSSLRAQATGTPIEIPMNTIESDLINP
jgi:hypothetical protein